MVWIEKHSKRALTKFLFVATFQIIKKLLPAKAVDRLKFLNAKNVKEFVDGNNIPVAWKGTNAFEYSWTPEKISSKSSKATENNNGEILATNKKVSHAWNNFNTN